MAHKWKHKHTPSRQENERKRWFENNGCSRPTGLDFHIPGKGWERAVGG